MLSKRRAMSCSQCSNTRNTLHARTSAAPMTSTVRASSPVLLLAHHHLLQFHNVGVIAGPEQRNLPQRGDRELRGWRVTRSRSAARPARRRTPSRTPECRITRFRATMSPVSESRARYTVPYVPSPSLSTLAKRYTSLHRPRGSAACARPSAPALHCRVARAHIATVPTSASDDDAWDMITLRPACSTATALCSMKEKGVRWQSRVVIGGGRQKKKPDFHIMRHGDSFKDKSLPPLERVHAVTLPLAQPSPP